MPDHPDVDGDGNKDEPISQAQKDKEKEEGKSGKKPAAKPKKGEIPPQLRKHVKNESKIQTPEQENSLYESRFGKRNTNLFNRLLKEWNIVGEQELAMNSPEFGGDMSVSSEPEQLMSLPDDDNAMSIPPEELSQKAASQERNLRRAGFRSMERLQAMVGAEKTEIGRAHV